MLVRWKRSQNYIIYQELVTLWNEQDKKILVCKSINKDLFGEKIIKNKIYNLFLDISKLLL